MVTAPTSPDALAPLPMPAPPRLVAVTVPPLMVSAPELSALKLLPPMPALPLAPPLAISLPMVSPVDWA